MPSKINEHRECFRRCFGTPDGKKVLANLLIDMGFFDPNTESLELRNYATQIVRTLGFCDTPNKVDQLVDKMFEVTQGE